jgi:3,4-dihydroxy-2-butanone 4-phosphate synthase
MIRHCGAIFCVISPMNVAICVHLCILYNQRDATYTMFFIIISALHVWGGFSAHHRELIKLCVQPWVLSCFPAVCR